MPFCYVIYPNIYKNGSGFSLTLSYNICISNITALRRSEYCRGLIEVVHE